MEKDELLRQTIQEYNALGQRRERMAPWIMRVGREIRAGDMSEVRPFADEDVGTAAELKPQLEAELASLDRRRFYILSLLGRISRETSGQLTFVEELDGQDD